MTANAGPVRHRGKHGLAWHGPAWLDVPPGKYKACLPARALQSAARHHSGWRCKRARPGGRRSASRSPGVRGVGCGGVEVWGRGGGVELLGACRSKAAKRMCCGHSERRLGFAACAHCAAQRSGHQPSWRRSLPGRSFLLTSPMQSVQSPTAGGGGMGAAATLRGTAAASNAAAAADSIPRLQ